MGCNLLCAILFLSGTGFTQNLDSLETVFRSFEYGKVIEIADELLQDRNSLSEETQIEILRMRALAAYSIDEEIEAEISFKQILDLDRSFSLSEQETSPKIIEFFEKIKSSYEPKIEPIKVDTIPVADSTLYFYRNALARSLLLPGMGHLYMKKQNKAFLLGIPAGATLVSGIYYIFLTSKRENDYLNETREIEIERKYNAYNSAYKRRNILLVLYGVIWIYSQYDLLVNGERYLREENRISMYPVLDQQYVPQLTLRIKF